MQATTAVPSSHSKNVPGAKPVERHDSQSETNEQTQYSSARNRNACSCGRIMGLVFLFHPQGIVVPVNPLIDARPDNLGEATNPRLPGNQKHTVPRNLPAMKGVSGSALFRETVVRVKSDE